VKAKATATAGSSALLRNDKQKNRQLHFNGKSNCRRRFPSGLTTQKQRNDSGNSNSKTKQTTAGSSALLRNDKQKNRQLHFNDSGDGGG
jgi:hypothetical protein